MPVQMNSLGREVVCPCPISTKTKEELEVVYCGCQKTFYDALLKAINHAAFKHGQHRKIYTDNKDIFVRQWTYENVYLLVVVNYSDQTQRETLEISGVDPETKIIDRLNGATNPSWVIPIGGSFIKIQLPPFKSSIIEITNQR